MADNGNGRKILKRKIYEIQTPDGKDCFQDWINEINIGGDKEDITFKPQGQEMKIHIKTYIGNKNLQNAGVNLGPLITSPIQPYRAILNNGERSATEIWYQHIIVHPAFPKKIPSGECLERFFEAVLDRLAVDLTRDTVVRSTIAAQFKKANRLVDVTKWEQIRANMISCVREDRMPNPDDPNELIPDLSKSTKIRAKFFCTPKPFRSGMMEMNPGEFLCTKFSKRKIYPTGKVEFEEITRNSNLEYYVYRKGRDPRMFNLQTAIQILTPSIYIDGGLLVVQIKILDEKFMNKLALPGSVMSEEEANSISTQSNKMLESLELEIIDDSGHSGSQQDQSQPEEEYTIPQGPPDPVRVAKFVSELTDEDLDALYAEASQSIQKRKNPQIGLALTSNNPQTNEQELEPTNGNLTNPGNNQQLSQPPLSPNQGLESQLQGNTIDNSNQGETPIPDPSDQVSQELLVATPQQPPNNLPPAKGKGSKRSIAAVSSTASHTNKQRKFT